MKRAMENGDGRLVARLLLLSGGLEILLGIGHSVVGTLMLTRPRAMAPMVAAMHWPPSVLDSIPSLPQLGLILGVSLGAGVSFMIFGVLVVWQARRRPVERDRTLLVIVLVQQWSFLVLMLIFIRFHLLAIIQLTLMATALSWAVARMSPATTPVQRG